MRATYVSHPSLREPKTGFHRLAPKMMIQPHKEASRCEGEGSETEIFRHGRYDVRPKVLKGDRKYPAQEREVATRARETRPYEFRACFLVYT